jgi:hypothetical protein
VPSSVRRAATQTLAAAAPSPQAVAPLPPLPQSCLAPMLPLHRRACTPSPHLRSLCPRPHHSDVELAIAIIGGRRTDLAVILLHSGDCQRTSPAISTISSVFRWPTPLPPMVSDHHARKVLGTMPEPNLVHCLDLFPCRLCCSALV